MANSGGHSPRAGRVRGGILGERVAAFPDPHASTRGFHHAPHLSPYGRGRPVSRPPWCARPRPGVVDCGPGAAHHPGLHPGARPRDDRAVHLFPPLHAARTVVAAAADLDQRFWPAAGRHCVDAAADGCARQPGARALDLDCPDRAGG